MNMSGYSDLQLNPLQMTEMYNSFRNKFIPVEHYQCVMCMKLKEYKPVARF